MRDLHHARLKASSEVRATDSWPVPRGALRLRLEPAGAADHRDEIDLGGAPADDVAQEVDARAGRRGAAEPERLNLRGGGDDRSQAVRLLAADSGLERDPRRVDGRPRRAALSD